MHGENENSESVVIDLPGGLKIEITNEILEEWADNQQKILDEHEELLEEGRTGMDDNDMNKAMTI